MIAVARLAILVGIAGLIPFIGLLAGLFFMPQYSVALLGYFYLYSAGILAFMERKLRALYALEIRPEQNSPPENRRAHERGARNQK